VPEALALHVHRGTRAVQRMVEFAPSTGGLALWVHHRDLPAQADAPAASTDGHTVFYGGAFEAMPLALQAGLVAHEVLHIALRHAQRGVELNRLVGDLDWRLYNVCADAIVNSALGHLGWLALPASAIRLETLLSSVLGVTSSAESALLEWDVERLYREIDDRRPAPAEPDRAGQRRSAQAGQAGQQGQSGRHAQQGTSGQPSGGAAAPGDGARAGSGAPRHEPSSGAPQASAHARRPREDGPRAARTRTMGAASPADLIANAHDLDAPEDEAEQAREWSERLTRAHAGDGALSMLRSLLADLPRPRTPWEQALRTQLAHSLARRPALSWSRPSRSYIAHQGRAGPHRRMPWEPGTGGTSPVARLAVIVDVSGSIADALLERFAVEIEAISRRLEAALVLVVGDDQVRRVAHFEPGRSDLREIGFGGGGGTDFTPLLEEAQRHRPDIVVVLTDLQGPARAHPRCPVVWAVPETWPMPQAPFGRLLALR
jgi:predicted metal-dependent peptidase